MGLDPFTSPLCFGEVNTVNDPNNRTIWDNLAEIEQLGRRLDEITNEMKKLRRQLDGLDARAPVEGSGRAQRRAMERWSKKLYEYETRYDQLEAEGRRIVERLKELMAAVKQQRREVNS